MSSTPPQWEYQVAPVLNHAAGAILNNFGHDGWELVALLPTPGWDGQSSGQAIAYFKRPKGA